jgi:Flp pilus assembly protein TadD
MRRDHLLFFLVLLLALSVASGIAQDSFPGIGKLSDWKRATQANSKGAALARAGQTDLAVSEFRQAIAIYPFDPYFHANLALLYENNKKDFSAAEKLFLHAIGLAPSNSDFHLAYAGLLFEKHNYGKCLAELKKGRHLANNPAQKQKAKQLESALREVGIK